MARVRAGFFGEVVGSGAASPAPFFAPGRIGSDSAGLRGAFLRLGVGLRKVMFEWLRAGR